MVVKEYLGKGEQLYECDITSQGEILYAVCVMLLIPCVVAVRWIICTLSIQVELCTAARRLLVAKMYQ